MRFELEISVQALANAARLSRLRYDTGLANYLEDLIADQQVLDQELFLRALAAIKSTPWCNSTALPAAGGSRD